jgi:dynein heavy chain
MIVGQTTSGKTACYEVLAHSMTSLRKKLMQECNTTLLNKSNYKIVKTHCLNPKAISMGELYGEVNELTQ